MLDQIAKYIGEPANKETIAWLNMCRGAYKAICMADKKEYAAAVATKSDDKPAYNAELDGNTEFERVIMSIPADKAHMVAITQILNDHMTQLAIMHRRSYDNVMMRLREVARN